MPRSSPGGGWAQVELTDALFPYALSVVSIKRENKRFVIRPLKRHSHNLLWDVVTWCEQTLSRRILRQYHQDRLSGF